MSKKDKLKEIFEVESKYGAFYTGGMVEWVPDGSQLFCQCGPSLSIVDAQSGCVTNTLGVSEDTEIDDDVVSFALSRDNKHVVSSHRSGLFRLWAIADGKVVKMWKSIHKGPVVQLSLSDSGTILASGGSDSCIRLWDLVHQSCTHSLSGIQGVTSVLAFHTDKSRTVLLGAADDAVIVGWSVKTGQACMSLKGHLSRVCALVCHSNSRNAVSCGRDKVVILWDLEKQSAVNTIPLYESLEALILLPQEFSTPAGKNSSGICVAVGGERGVIRVWDVTASKELFVQSNSVVSKARDEGGLAITKLLWNANLGALAVVTVEHKIIFHKLDSFECIKQMIGFCDEILDVALLGEGDSHLAVATNSVDVALYRLSDMNCSVLPGHADLILGLATSKANSRIFASCSKDHSVRIWQLNEDGNGATCVGQGQRHTAAVGCVSFGQMSSRLFVSAGQDHCVKLWDLPQEWNSGKEPVILNATRTELAHEKDINSITCSPNDRLIASGSQDKTAKLWNIDNFSLLGVLRGHRRGVWCVRFSPVDQILLTTSADCSLRLWSLQDLSCIKTFEGHDSSVVRGDFLSSGLQLLTAGGDGLMKLWVIKTGLCVATLDQHNGRIWGITISSDEMMVVSGGADSLLVKWKDVTQERRNAAVEERERITLLEQQLANLIHNDELLSALKLSLKLQRPHKSLTIIQGILKKGEISGLHSTVSQLSAEQQEELVKYAVTWNTNGKHCYTAQAVLSVVLDLISSGRLRMEGLRSVLEGVLPYSDRHMKRVAQLQQDLHLLALTANCMQPHASADPLWKK